MTRQGRKRKQKVMRYASGQIVHSQREPNERPDEIMATALKYREKHVGPKYARSQFAGYALGRLFLQETITGRQHSAGWRWTKLAVQYAQVMGFQKPSPKSPAIMMVSFGLSCIPEHDEEEIARVRRAYSDAYRALLDLEADHPGVNRVLRDCCIEDRDPQDTKALGNLRVALNVLCRLWREA